jgi:hypothetical protein
VRKLSRRSRAWVDADPARGLAVAVLRQRNGIGGAVYPLIELMAERGLAEAEQLAGYAAGRDLPPFIGGGGDSPVERLVKAALGVFGHPTYEWGWAGVGSQVRLLTGCHCPGCTTLRYCGPYPVGPQWAWFELRNRRAREEVRSREVS